MAPDAPQPTYDSCGNVVAPWHVIIIYDPVVDLLRFSWAQGEGTYHGSGGESVTYPEYDVEDALAALQRRCRILSARRLL